MAETSAIEWTDSTFNPWIGCTKIAPACDHCYAADWARRYKKDVWGNVPRQRTSAATWREPLKWQRHAADFLAEHGRRRRVFCASLADVFDNQVAPAWRGDLWALIRDTPDLDWLLLTKRPQNIVDMLPDFWDDVKGHVWLGTTVEDQEHADKNIRHLLKHDAAVRFISVEPMLGPIDLRAHFSRIDGAPGQCFDIDGERWHALGGCRYCRNALDWVIGGGESGPQARPSDPRWFRSLRDQCAAAGVPFLFKQWGCWVPAPEGITEQQSFRWAEDNNHGRLGRRGEAWGSTYRMPSEWSILEGDRYMFPTAKARAGRLLDGVEHNGFPEVR